MKKLQRVIFMAALSMAVMFGLTGCGEDITLESKTTEGITMDVPSDFGEFKDQDGLKIAVNEDSTASIAVTPVQDAEGVTPEMFDEETYRQNQLDAYTDIEMLKYDQKAEVNGIPALYAHTKVTNDSNVKIEMHNYFLFYEDGTFQNIAVGFTRDAGSFLEENIDAVLKSIKK